jgi:hypothetical protein
MGAAFLGRRRDRGSWIAVMEKADSFVRASVAAAYRVTDPDPETWSGPAADEKA